MLHLAGEEGRRVSRVGESALTGVGSEFRNPRDQEGSSKVGVQSTRGEVGAEGRHGSRGRNVDRLGKDQEKEDLTQDKSLASHSSQVRHQDHTHLVDQSYSLGNRGEEGVVNDLGNHFFPLAADSDFVVKAGTTVSCMDRREGFRVWTRRERIRSG